MALDDLAAQRQEDGAIIAQMRRQQTPTMGDLVDLARLRMRYSQGPLRLQLDQQLLRWDITEAALHELCRAHWANYKHAPKRLPLHYGSGADISSTDK